MKPSLFLIPNTLGEDNPENVLPVTVLETLRELTHFIVENERNARRFLIRCKYLKPIDQIKFYELNKHTSKEDVYEFLEPCRQGINMGMISDAGAPGVADPGSDIVSLAHTDKIRVRPLTGPSSILLALMASGMNGQQFTFHGYLPVKPGERKASIKEIESKAKKTGYTQIFMETPYRNMALFASVLETCYEDSRLCIACDISLEREFILTQRIKEWKKERVDLNKRPCIFMIG